MPPASAETKRPTEETPNETGASASIAAGRGAADVPPARAATVLGGKYVTTTARLFKKRETGEKGENNEERKMGWSR